MALKTKKQKNLTYSLSTIEYSWNICKSSKSYKNQIIIPVGWYFFSRRTILLISYNKHKNRRTYNRILAQPSTSIQRSDPYITMDMVSCCSPDIWKATSWIGHLPYSVHRSYCRNMTHSFNINFVVWWLLDWFNLSTFPARTLYYGLCPVQWFSGQDSDVDPKATETRLCCSYIIATKNRW